MSDTLIPNETSELSDAERAAISPPSAVGSLPGEPPLAPEHAATTGADVPPAGPDSAPGATTLIDTPDAAHAAFNQGEPEVPAELLPPAVETETPPAIESEPAPDAPPLVETPPPEIGIDPFEEDPLVTINRLRTKLAAYGEECLKTIQPEIEYLIRLCDQSNDIEG